MNRYLVFIIIWVSGACLLQSQAPSGYTWQEVANVDFGGGMNRFMIQAASAESGGELEMRLGAVDGPVLGRVFFHHTGDPGHFMDYGCDLSQTVNGIQTVYFNYLDYAAPAQGGTLFVRDYAFDWVVAEPVPNAGDFYLYPPVAGLEPSPYYEYSIQKVSELNAENLKDVTNWESTYAWFTQCRDKGVVDGNKGYYSGYIGGWSHTYTNFELDPNTPIVVKITRKDNTGDDAPSGPILSAAVHPVDNVESMELIDGEVYVTLCNPTQVTVDIDGQMDTRPTPRAEPTGFGGNALAFGTRADGAHAVSIFANPVIADKPNPNDPNVLVVEAGALWPPADIDATYWDTLYFEPGIHRMSMELNGEGQLVERTWREEDIIPLRSNKNYYIPGDAIVYGNFTNHFKDTKNNEDIRIYGHGTISGSKIDHYKAHPDYPKAEFPEGMPGSDRQRVLYLEDSSERCRFEGVTLADPANHSLTMNGSGLGSENANHVDWVKLISWRANSDALSVGGNSYVEDCFLRTQDDGHYVSDTNLRRVILWIDVNGIPFRSSFLTRNEGRTTILEDIDLIYGRGGAFGKGGIVSQLTLTNTKMDNGFENTGQLIHFKNLNFSDSMPQDAFMTWEAWQRDRVRVGDFAGVRFENVNVASKSVFNLQNALLEDPDLDPDDYVQNSLIGNQNANVHNLVFDNLVIAGERVDAAYFYNPENFKTEYVSDITFRQTYVIAPSDQTLTTTAIHGTIRVEPVGDGSSDVAVTAIPLPGYSFNSWQGNLSGTNSGATIAVDSDLSIMAAFDAMIPGRIQAEHFNSQSGVEVWPTSDGGKAVISINDGDFLEYQVSTKKFGSYGVNLRVASGTAGGTIDVYSDSIFLGSIKIPYTGGSDVWTTVQSDLNYVPGGSQTLRFNFSGGAGALFDLNWIDFTYIGSTATRVPGRVEAEITEDHADGLQRNFLDGGVAHLNWIHNGRWAEYLIDVRETGTFPLVFRTTGSKGGAVQVIVDGQNLGTASIPGSGENMVESSINVNFASLGRKTLRLEFAGNGEFLFQLDWVEVRAPVELPSTINAADYTDSQGVVTETSNAGGQHIGFINNGDWTEYRVNVVQPGPHTVDFRIASDGNGGTININADGELVGSLDYAGNETWQNWETVSTEVVFLKTGPQALRLEFSGSGFLYNIKDLALAPVQALQLNLGNVPTGTLNGGGITYQMTASISPDGLLDDPIIWLSSNGSVATVNATGLITTTGNGSTTITAMTSEGLYSDQVEISVVGAFPLRIEAEDFTAMSGVVIEACSEGGNQIGYVNNGNWTEYFVSVPEAGTYLVDVRYSSDGSGGVMDLSASGQTIGTVAMPKTTGWFDWKTVSAEVTFAVSGPQTLRLDFSGSGVFLYNINWIEFKELTDIVFPMPTAEELQIGLNGAGGSGIPSPTFLRPAGGVETGASYTMGNLTYHLEASFDLVNWDAVVEVVIDSGNLSTPPDGYEWSAFRLSEAVYDLTSIDSVFYRIRVEDNSDL